MEDEEIKEIPNSKRAYDYLVSKGVKEHIAAGIVGNLMQESYKLDKIWVDGKLDSVGSKGIMQWHGKRLDALYDFQKQKDQNYINGKPISLTDQLDFILHEAETGAGDNWMKKQYDKAFNAKTAEEAALLFSKNVLRPHKDYAHNDKRISYAKAFGVETEEDTGLTFNKNYKKYIDPELLITKKDNISDFKQVNIFKDPFFKTNNLDIFEDQNKNQEITDIEEPTEIINNQENTIKQGSTQTKQTYTDFIQEYLNQIKSTNENAMGGNLNFPDMSGNPFNEFNEGGTHEQNPHGGVPQGLGSNGKMNTVEEGETSFNFEEGKYIFSNRIKI